MEDFSFWHNLAYSGTNEWIKNFVLNNYYIVGPPLIAAGAYIKGKYPEFFAKLSTIIPFVGDHRKIGG